MMSTETVSGIDNGMKQTPNIESVLENKKSAPPVSDNTYFFEEVSIDIDTEKLDEYQCVPEELSDESEADVSDDEGLRQTIASLKQNDLDAKSVTASSPDLEQTSTSHSRRMSTATTSGRAPVVDDFIRNFLLRNAMTRTLHAFQTEWYELHLSGKYREYKSNEVPDVYVTNDIMAEQMQTLRNDLLKMKTIATNAKATWNKLRKQRDFHRMHHRRVVQEKSKLVVDMKRLKKSYSTFDPTLKALKQKYEGAMKEKMMMRLERDKLHIQVEAFEAQTKAAEKNTSTEKKKSCAKTGGEVLDKNRLRKPRNDSTLPEGIRLNPYTDIVFEAMSAKDFTLKKTFKGHSMSIAAIATHPSKPVVVTVSDDRSWKLWSVPNGELIFCGEGHNDWIAGVDFHPDGRLLGTSSADGTVKIWDFDSATCRSTLSDHAKVVWGLAFHDLGDFVVSCSIDHCAKLWDLETERCRQTFRGHVDSVNSIGVQPFTNTIVTGSGDKTVSMWDLRSGLCTQTFFGHANAITHATFNLQGDAIVSSDADGVLKLWDIRQVNERLDISPSNAVNHPVNQTIFDPSGRELLSAVDDGTLKIHRVSDGCVLSTKIAHDNSVQCVAADRQGQFLFTGGSDCTFRLWS